MHNATLFLRSFTVVLAVAAMVTIIFQRLRWPVVLGYILAGLLVGPHVPFPLVADPEVVQTLSELGVILLMFVLGLEFKLSELSRGAPTAGAIALFQCGIMLWLGFLAGRLLGWTRLESVFTGAVVSMSSTTIVTKVFDERGVTGKLRELVVGILLMEDLIAVILIASLTALGTGAAITAGSVGGTIGQLALFLAAILLAGFLIIPRLIRMVLRLQRAEITVIASLAICFTMAWTAHAAGYSVALGAFLAGSLIAETGRGSEVEQQILPVRDLFTAVFFVAVGLTIDPHLIVRHWGAVALLSALVVVGMTVSVTIGAFITGTGSRTAIQAGMSLAQIGEFSFIIAGLGLALGVTGRFFYTVTVAVSAVTTMLTPLLIGRGDAVARYIDRKLPHALQTYTTLYGAWMERLRTGRFTRRAGSGRRVVRLLLIDTLALVALTLGVIFGADPTSDWLVGVLPFGSRTAIIITVAIAGALATPLILGIGRLTGRLGRVVASTSLPKPRRGADFDAAPRRALEITIQLAVVMVITVLILAVAQPFLPLWAGALLFAALLSGFGITLWRSASDLDSHVRAGSEAVVSALRNYALPEPTGEFRAIQNVQDLMPGLGATVAVQLTATSQGVGKTLAKLDLRGRTGASVLAIRRDGVPIINPGAKERLAAGDILALTGTADALEAAHAALIG